MKASLSSSSGVSVVYAGGPSGSCTGLPLREASMASICSHCLRMACLYEFELSCNFWISCTSGLRELVTLLARAVSSLKVYISRSYLSKAPFCIASIASKCYLVSWAFISWDCLPRVDISLSSIRLSSFFASYRSSIVQYLIFLWLNPWHCLVCCQMIHSLG